VAISGDGQQALSSGGDRTLRLWNLAALQQETLWTRIGTVAPTWVRRLVFRPIRTMKGHTAWVRSVALSADGLRALSGGDDGTLRLWDLERGQELSTLSGHVGVVRSVTLSADGQRALSSGDDRTLRLWNLATGRCQAIFHTDNPITSCALFPHSQAVLVSDAGGRIFVLRILWAAPDSMASTFTP
jgi:hypothetical protein